MNADDVRKEMKQIVPSTKEEPNLLNKLAEDLIQEILNHLEASFLKPEQCSRKTATSCYVSLENFSKFTKVSKELQEKEPFNYYRLQPLLEKVYKGIKDAGYKIYGVPKKVDLLPTFFYVDNPLHPMMEGINRVDPYFGATIYKRDDRWFELSPPTPKNPPARVVDSYDDVDWNAV